MEPALSCSSCHIHWVSRARVTQALLMESCSHSEAGPGRPLQQPRLEQILREGLRQSKRFQNQELLEQCWSLQRGCPPTRVTGNPEQGTVRTGEKQEQSCCQKLGPYHCRALCTNPNPPESKLHQGRAPGKPRQAAPALVSSTSPEMQQRRIHRQPSRQKMLPECKALIALIPVIMAARLRFPITGE